MAMPCRNKDIIRQSHLCVGNLSFITSASNELVFYNSRKAPMENTSSKYDFSSNPPAYDDVPHWRREETLPASLIRAVAISRAQRIRHTIDDNIMPEVSERCAQGVSRITIFLDLLTNDSIGRSFSPIPL